TLAARLKRRSLIVLFSDFSDTTSAELMIESVERLVRHHLVIFVTMEDAELAQLTDADPVRLRDLAAAVAADGLARQRALVLQRLRRLGVDVIEAPWQAIGYRLIDRYLAAKQAEAVGCRCTPSSASPKSPRLPTLMPPRCVPTASAPHAKQTDGGSRL